MGWAETGRAELMFGPKRDGPKRAGPNRAVTGNYIMNLQDSHEGGSHWVAFIKNKSNIFYHDSYAVIMPQNQYDLFKSEKIIYIIIHYRNNL